MADAPAVDNPPPTALPENPASPLPKPPAPAPAPASIPPLPPLLAGREGKGFSCPPPVVAGAGRTRELGAPAFPEFGDDGCSSDSRKSRRRTINLAAFVFAEGRGGRVFALVFEFFVLRSDNANEKSKRSPPGVLPRGQT